MILIRIKYKKGIGIMVKALENIRETATTVAAVTTAAIVILSTLKKKKKKFLIF
jgi:hypothetical protein